MALKWEFAEPYYQLCPSSNPFPILQSAHLGRCRSFVHHPIRRSLLVSNCCEMLSKLEVHSSNVVSFATQFATLDGANACAMTCTTACHYCKTLCNTFQLRIERLWRVGAGRLLPQGQPVSRATPCQGRCGRGGGEHHCGRSSRWDGRRLGQ